MYYTYILFSPSRGRYYYGSTSDLKARLNHHNAGRVCSTKYGVPWQIHYYETFPTRQAAMHRERFFKTIAGYNWLGEHKIIDR